MLIRERARKGVRERRHEERRWRFADRLLKEANVALVPGEAFGTNDHVRISYATSMQELERGLERIDQFVQKLG